MKRKIIFVSFCLMLLLIFTTLSYGDIDPKYKHRARPHQELLSPPSPPNGNQFDDVLLLIIPNWNGFSLLIWTKNDSPKESPVMQSLTSQEAKSITNNAKRAR